MKTRLMVWASMLAVALAAACDSSSPNFTGVDGHVDDAAPDAVQCAPSEVQCGSTCANLMTDPDNCGACGWNVTRGRRCEMGKPMPAWQPIPTAGAPTGRYALTFWTGRRLLVAIGRTQYAYSPASNQWSMLTSEVPFEPRATDAVVTLPERKTTFVWASNDDVRMPPSNASYIFVDQDDASAGWEANAAGAPSPRRQVAITRRGSSVYVMFGQQGVYDGTPQSLQGLNDGGRYDLDTRQWTPVPADPGGCDGQGRTYNPIAIAGGKLMTMAGAHGASVLPCNGPARALDLTGGTWSAADMTLGSRIRHVWVAANGRFVLVGGAVAGANDTTPAFNNTAVVTPAGHVTVGQGPLPMGAQLGYGLAAGRSVLVFSGVTQYYDGTMVMGGAIGPVDDQNIAWSLLPSTGAPAPRMNVATEGSYSLGNQQQLWSGREAIVFGGHTRTSGFATAWLDGGAGYQPPAACVCPTDEDPDGTCAGVSHIAATGCVP